MNKKIYISNIQFNSLNESLKSQLSAERKTVDKNPSQKQIEAGNYSKGHITIMGLDITIENPKGSYRKGVDKNGNEWKILMNNDYGYFRRTLGKDGDAIDVFIGPNLSSEKIFPIDQYLGGNFDETKVMLGFNTAADAKKAYMSNYEKGWKGFKYISEVNLEDFKKWLYDGYRQRKPFAKYKTLFENHNIMKMNESKQGLQSKKLFDIIKKYGNKNHYNTSWFDLQSVKDEDVVGVFTLNELPKTHAELKKWVISKGYQLDTSDDVAVYELDKTDNGYIAAVVIIVPNANYDGTSFSKEGGYKNYIQKKQSRESARNNDGAKTYNWKGGNELSDLSLKNPYYQKWNNGAKKNLDSRIKDVYGKTYDRVKGLNESYVEEAFEEYRQEDLLTEFLSDKENGVKEKKWSVIPKEQYHNILKRYMELGEMAKIPDSIINGWIEDIIIPNALSILYITEFAGHSEYVPIEAVEDVFGSKFYDNYSSDYDGMSDFLEEIGFYDWCTLPDGSNAWSDFGINPIFQLINSYEGCESVEEKLILINRVLDIAHQRGDLASAFIEGGRKSCEHISLSEGIDKDMLNKYKDSRRKEDIANHGKPTAFYGKVEKSKKAYSRKGKNKFNPEDELDESCGKRKVHLTEAQFKQFCRTLLENRRNEEYVEKIVKDIIS